MLAILPFVWPRLKRLKFIGFELAAYEGTQVNEGAAKREFGGTRQSPTDTSKLIDIEHPVRPLAVSAATRMDQLKFVESPAREVASMAAGILATLWKKQLEYDPSFKTLWGFNRLTDNPIWLQAVGSLYADRRVWISRTDDDRALLVLTQSGATLCLDLHDELVGIPVIEYADVTPSSAAVSEARDTIESWQTHAERRPK